MNIGTLTATLGVDTSGLYAAEAAVLRFQKVTTSHFAAVTTKWRTFGYMASVAMTAPLLAAGKSALTMYKDFDFTMNQIVALVGIARDEVDEWGKDILRIAPSLGKSPKELADALYFVTSSGYKSAQALDIVNKSAQAAATGLGSTKEIADLVTSAMNAYKDTGLTATRTLDILVAAVREGKGEADAFAKTIGAVIPFASELGVSFDQVAGSMAAMTLTGSSAANASTYLRNIFKSLMDPAKHVETALREMGTSSAVLRNMLGEQGLMPTLVKIRELTEQYGTSMMSQVFPNIRGLLGALILLGDNFEYNVEVMDLVNKSTGSAARAFLETSKTVEFRLNAAISAANSAWITFGKSVAETVLPILEKLVVFLQRLVEWFNNLSAPTRRFIIIIGAVMAALGPLALLIALFRYMLPAFALAINGVTTALFGLRAAMLANPILALITLVGAYVLQWAIARKRMDEATVSQKKLNEELKRGEDLRKGLDPLVTSAKAFKLMKAQELEELKGGLENQLQAERDHTIKLAALAIERIEDDKMVARIQEQIMAATNDLYKAGLVQQLNERKKFLVADLDLEYKASQQRVAIIEKSLAEIRETWKRKTFVEAVDEAIGELWTTMRVGEDEIEHMSKVFKALGIEFDREKRLVDLYNKTLEGLVNEGLTDTDEKVQYVANRLKIMQAALEAIEKAADKTKLALQNMGKVKKVFDDLGASLSAARVKVYIDPKFDIDQANIDAYKKAYEEYLEIAAGAIEKLRVASKVPGVMGTASMAAMSGMINIVRQLKAEYENWVEAKERASDVQMLNILQAEADAFGGLASKIEVVNFALKAEQKVLRNLLMDPKTDPLSDGIQRIVANIRQWKKELLELQSVQELTFLADMDREFGTTGTKINLLSGYINTLQSKLKFLSEEGLGTSEEFKKFTEELTNAERALVNLQNQESLQYLEKMNNALHSARTASDLFQGRITALNNEMQYLAKAPGDNTAAFNKLAKELRGLEIGVKVADELTGAFNQMFDALIDGGQNIGDVLKDIFKGLLKEIVHLIIQTVVLQTALKALGIDKAATDNQAANEKALAGAILAVTGATVAKTVATAASVPATQAAASAASNLAVASAAAEGAKMPFPVNIAAIAAGIGAVVAGIALGQAAVSALSKATPGLKKGGIIPPGYPDDTFPAFLSSGEVIVPKKRYEEYKDEPVWKGLPKLPKLQYGGTVPSGYPNDTFPAWLTSGETVIPLKKNSGGEKVLFNILDELKALVDLQNKVSLAPITSDWTPPPQFLKIVDKRLLDAITGQPVSSKSRLHGNVDTAFVEEVTKKSIARGLDPMIPLAISHQETGGFNPEYMDNPFAILFQNMEELSKFDLDPIGYSLDFINKKLELAKRLGETTTAGMVQFYNGVGKLMPDSFGAPVKKAYGVEIPPEGINMRENPLYGKRIEDIINGIFSQNEALLRAIEDAKKNNVFSPTQGTNNKGNWNGVGPGPGVGISGLDQYGVIIRDVVTGADNFVAVNEKVNESLNKSGGILQSTTSYLTQYANAQVQAKTQGKGLLAQLTGMGIGVGVEQVGKLAGDKLSGLLNKKKGADEAGGAAESSANAAANMAEGASGLFKESGKQPFPVNLVAVALSIAAIIAMIAVVARARSAAKMASGGLIPPGYPNDTFPAMLSSGEMVIPKMNVPKFTSDQFENEEGGEVRFEIEGDRLVGILKKQGKKLQIY